MLTSTAAGYDLTLVQLAFCFAYLAVVLLLAVDLYGFGLLFGSRHIKELACWYTLRAIQAAGPVFIKLGQ